MEQQKENTEQWIPLNDFAREHGFSSGSDLLDKAVEKGIPLDRYKYGPFQIMPKQESSDEDFTKTTARNMRAIPEEVTNNYIVPLDWANKLTDALSSKEKV